MKLQEQITKHSPTLGRDAVYTKTCRIKRLPAYLTVQFVRFFYKERGSTNAKILKDIKFTLSLDVFDLCTEELQNRLLPARNKFKEIEDAKVAESEKLKKGEEEKPKHKHPFSFPEDVGSNNSGYYELQAVLTHKGRSSSSGHYIGWIRRKENEWFKCDDDTVSMVTSDEILKLSGGGLCFNISLSSIFFSIIFFCYFFVTFFSPSFLLLLRSFFVFLSEKGEREQR